MRKRKQWFFFNDASQPDDEVEIELKKSDKFDPHILDPFAACKEGYDIENGHSVNLRTQNFINYYDENGCFPDMIIADRVRLSKRPKYHQMKRYEDYIIFDPQNKQFDCSIEFIIPSEDTKSYYAYVKIRINTVTTVEFLYGYISLNSDAIL